MSSPMKLGRETGSVMNHLMSAGSGKAPTVGDGATVLGWTDRTAGTIVAVSPSGKSFTVREDHAIRTDANGMSECQQYRFEPNPEGRTHEFRLTKLGWKVPGSRRGGASVLIGERAHYYDYSL